jgi:hypothetical protein
VTVARGGALFRTGLYVGQRRWETWPALNSLSPLTAADRTWGCPCHGSCFRIEGTVIDGLVVRELKRNELPDAGRR